VVAGLAWHNQERLQQAPAAMQPCFQLGNHPGSYLTRPMLLQTTVGWLGLFTILLRLLIPPACKCSAVHALFATTSKPQNTTACPDRKRALQIGKNDVMILRALANKSR